MEQVSHVTITIKSYTLGAIMKEHKSVLSKLKDYIEVRDSGFYLDMQDDGYLCNVPNDDKKAFKEFFSFLKQFIGKETKPLIKALEKEMKVILNEVDFSWEYVETCTKELAYEMAELSGNLDRNSKLDKYVFYRNYKNKTYTSVEKPFYL